MAEYIEREALIKRLEVTPILKYGVPTQVRDGVIDLVEKQPAADVEPVVRCKDCKHYHASEGWCDEHSSFIDGRGVKCHPWESSEWRMFNEDDFCSYGEREEG